MVSLSKALFSSLLSLPLDVYRQVANPDLAATSQYNIVKYLSGAGPFLEFSGYGISTDLPDNCTLEQVQLLMRHGERFPGLSAGLGYEAIIDRLQSYNQTIVGPLAFLNDYEWFVPDQGLYEYETTPANSDSPYSGFETAWKAGATFRSKYNSLYNDSQILPVFAGASARVVQTADFFTRGFLGANFTKDYYVYNVISENATQGFNTLTPRWGCTNYNSSANSAFVKEFPTDYLDTIVDRLVDENDGLNLTTADIQSLIQICGYELNAKGASPFCELFTQDEYVTNSYQNDLSFYYSAGPGHNLTKYVGWVQLNASLALLKDDDNEQKIWLSFIHDTDIELFHSALGLFDTIEPLPNDQVRFTDTYHHIDPIPMGARVITEKFSYSNDGESYVRFIINNSVKPIKGCSSGPGFSCKLSDFEEYVEERFGDFDMEDVCAPNPDYPQDLTFYWDWQGNEAYNITAPRIVN
ncbi:acid phosphatase [Yamadazyma tenuis]|uniref:Uncharacterized protein n=1 Tax=Candida tenuis (strain ATCC 10573 / BCRC 21748 / CBS 615 / JCM 9827 / NBRC 10315 / NRRL Y-1498 / VKM Y-70) TaxID=590646 RepID=G3B8R3_CANTC|nr:uncharacterized protein CANTEDRAFT_108495 [Yamadazyma tenuis ATCC 10573]EGV62411.1 hypothetical protein CANTEDRAFT_108495 [Yamadazyma tenuis ATCC 10573]WEJ93687.1 acid phosphatase [Yamadazyma tenuis]